MGQRQDGRQGALTPTGMQGSQAIVHVTLERFFDGLSGHDLDELVSLTDRLDEVLARYADGWTRPSADEAVLVAATKQWGHRGSAMDWAVAVRDEIAKSLSLDSSFGIASTRVTARICSRLARPRGVLLWLDGYEQALMARLPLEELDELTPDQLARLRSQGVRTLGEMAELSFDEARTLLGSTAAKLMGLVGGLDTSLMPPNVGRLDRAVSLLARRLARRLSRAGHKARGLELRVVFETSLAERYVLLPEASSEAPDIARAAQRLLALSPHRGQAITGLALTATGITATFGQLSLFHGARSPEAVVTLGRVRLG